MDDRVTTKQSDLYHFFPPIFWIDFTILTVLGFPKPLPPTQS